MRLSRFGTIVLSLCLLLSSSAAHSAIKLEERVPFDPQVKVGKLANGLTYYIRRNAQPAKQVELRLVVKVGSLQEDDDQQGLAHFVEHMAFNGSRHFKKHELISYLQSIGMEFGADLNASTSFEETIFQLTIPLDKRKKNLETGFLVMEDWAQGVTMNGPDVDMERAIVLEELRMGKGADDRAQRALLPKIYNGSRYAERLPGGRKAYSRAFATRPSSASTPTGIVPT